MPQNATHQQRAPQLSPQQIAALEALVTGSTVTDAARAAGVARESVHRWLRDDMEFIAARNSAVRDLRQETMARIERAAAAAADVVLKAVEGGDLSTAIKVLQGFGWLAGDARPTVGPSTADELRAEKETAARVSKQRRRLEAAFSDGLDDLEL